MIAVSSPFVEHIFVTVCITAHLSYMSICINLHILLIMLIKKQVFKMKPTQVTRMAQKYANKYTSKSLIQKRMHSNESVKDKNKSHYPEEDVSFYKIITHYYESRCLK